MLRVSIVIPTFNEAGNVHELLRRIETSLGVEGWEAIFVDDDSPDGTASLVRDIARGDQRVRVVQRIGRRGLSSACIEGMLASAAPAIAVMDADLQHDETRLPIMLQEMERHDADLVLATRYAGGGSTGEWDPTRAGMSRFATSLGRVVLKQPVSDPMSGFFLIRRELLDANVRRLSALGFKILLDVLATADGPVKLVEVPYTFRNRFAGESKLDGAALWDFGMLLADKAIGALPARPVRSIHDRRRPRRFGSHARAFRVAESAQAGVPGKPGNCDLHGDGLQLRREQCADLS